MNVLDSNSVEKLDRQWFLSRYGLDARETPRNISFCGHAILQREALVVPDTAKDPRFFDNPPASARPFPHAAM